MNFNFSRHRPRNVYDPRNFFRASSSSSSSRVWDYVLQPFWDDMNVGIAQDVVRTLTYRPAADPLESPVSGAISGQTLALTSQIERPPCSTVHFNWLETPTAHIFRADVPGLRKEDLTIQVEGTILRISGQQSAEHISADFNERFRWQAPFSRRFRLPANAIMDRINAVLDHGVLTLRIPKVQMLPSLAWFVPIDRYPSGVVIRPWTEQEQSQPDCREPDNQVALTRSRNESRIPDNAAPSSLVTQNVSLKEGEDVLARPEDSVSGGPGRSRSLSISSEYGTGPNARVTLNININTGKISEGESSCGKISPPVQEAQEAQERLQDASPATFRTSSPSLSKNRSKSSDLDGNGNEDDILSPSKRGRSTSPELEDIQDATPFLSPRSSLRRKSSVERMEDPEDEDLEPSPSPTSLTVAPPFPSPRSSLRRKSSVQRMEDPEVEDPEPPPAPTTSPASPIRRTSEAEKMEVKFEERTTERRMTAGDALAASSDREYLASRRKTVGDTPRNVEAFSGTKNAEGDANSRRASTSSKSQKTRKNEPERLPEQLEERRGSVSARKSSREVRRRKTGGDEPEDVAEKLEDRRGFISPSKGSVSRRKTGSDLAENFSGHPEGRRASGRKASGPSGRRPPTSSDVVERRASPGESAAGTERPESTKRGSVAGERRASARNASTVAERREPTKRDSFPGGKRASAREGSITEERRASHRERLVAGERGASAKKSSVGVGRRASTRSGEETSGRAQDDGLRSKDDDDSRGPHPVDQVSDSEPDNGQGELEEPE